MADDSINLKPLLLGDAPSAAISGCTKAAVETARRDPASGAPVDWTSVAANLGEKIGAMFDIPLIGAMALVWQDFQELRECADAAKRQPHETFVLPLVDHELEASFEPEIEVEISGFPAMRIGFEIAAGIKLRAVVLKIEGGIIRAVRIGSCQATAKVTCEGVVIIERGLRELDLPGEIRLPQGIPIGSTSAARA